MAIPAEPLPAGVLAVGSGPRSGMSIVHLSGVHTARAVELYLAVQGSRLASMGFTSEILAHYAEYLVENSKPGRCSIAVAGPGGQILGLLMYFDQPTPPSADLHPVAREHRETAIRLGRRATRLAPGESLPEIVFHGVHPSYQGKGLTGWMEHVSGQLAQQAGYARFWSWTLNPVMMKAQGTVDPGMWAVCRMAETLLKCSAGAMNSAVLPTLLRIGAIPKSYQVHIAPIAKFPLLANSGAKTDVVVAVVPFHTGTHRCTSPEDVAKQLARNAATAAALQPAKL
eukprot:TRINITY_DN21713_c0_g1_i1.p1 TRINITY_DN21713_c0_g1~~TRINITY_DN21713_c0_g1_i1.p1  ORF type:complete len:284 (+),score=49.45 TRINITY_DN21713_c0_g1_i1:79-930(+)